MIRTFLEYLLSRSHNEHTSPNGWLSRMLLRNAGLNRFDAETRQLDTLLRNTAAEQRQAMATEDNAVILTLPPRRETTRIKNAKRSFAWFSGLAACALLLVALAPNWFRPAPPTVHAGELSHQLSAVPGEVLRLLTSAAKTSQTELPKLSPLAKLNLPTMPAWQDVAQRIESPVHDEISHWQKNWESFKSLWPDQVQEL